MDELEQSDLKKTTNDSRNICYQNAIRDKCFHKKFEIWFIFSCFFIKLGGRMTEIFSVGLKKTDKGMKVWLNL